MEPKYVNSQPTAAAKQFVDMSKKDVTPMEFAALSLVLDFAALFLAGIFIALGASFDLAYVGAIVVAGVWLALRIRIKKPTSSSTE